MKINFKSTLLMLSATLCFFVAQAFSADLTLNIYPNTIKIGTFYNGTSVKVSGLISNSADVIVRLSGEGEELHLKKKGKVAGLLWMNTGDLTFQDAPLVYKIYTPKGMDNLDNSPAHEFGFSALKERVKIEPASEDSQFYLQEYIRLKQKQKLYSLNPGGVTYTDKNDGTKSYQTTIMIPPSLKQGNYSIDAAVIENGNLITTDSQPLILQQTGLPEKIATMAFGHAVWYGVMSVVIAIIAGLIMGVLFRGKGGAH